MNTMSTVERILRGGAILSVCIFFMFPIVWIFGMSFQTNETILRVPPSFLSEPTLVNYKGLISGQLETSAGGLKVDFMGNLFNSLF